MERHTKFRPSQFDSHIPLDGEQEDWFIAPCSRNRDSDCLTESNWAVMLKCLKECDRETEEDTYQIHRFGHWANGWFEIVVVKPGTEAFKECERMEAALADYPILDESDFSEREHEAANLTWRDCYSIKQRIEYIEDHRSQFEFHSLADMMGCVRGKYFAGYASELLG